MTPLALAMSGNDLVGLIIAVLVAIAESSWSNSGS